MLGRPAIDSIPNIDRIQKRRRTDATICIGRGKSPIAQLTTMSMRRFHNVIWWLFRVKRSILGMEIPDMGAYPKNQRTISMRTSVVNIGYWVSTSVGVMGKNNSNKYMSPHATQRYTIPAISVDHSMIDTPVADIPKIPLNGPARGSVMEYIDRVNPTY